MERVTLMPQFDRALPVNFRAARARLSKKASFQLVSALFNRPDFFMYPA
jgi:hypothetical protein